MFWILLLAGTICVYGVRYLRVYGSPKLAVAIFSIVYLSASAGSAVLAAVVWINPEAGMLSLLQLPWRNFLQIIGPSAGVTWIVQLAAGCFLFWLIAFIARAPAAKRESH